MKTVCKGKDSIVGQVLERMSSIWTIHHDWKGIKTRATPTARQVTPARVGVLAPE